MWVRIKKLRKGRLDVAHKEYEAKNLNFLGLLIAALYNLWYFTQNLVWEITDHIPRHTAIHLIEKYGKRQP